MLQGLRIATYSWKAEEARGAVITIHGYSSFAEWEFMAYPNQAYEGSMVQAFNNLGLNVHGIDLQGFGRSDGYGGMRGTSQQGVGSRSIAKCGADGIVTCVVSGPRVIVFVS